MDIDHIFLRARRNAPEGDALRAFGLAEGSGNRHPGQGTANRRFFFHNAFIELLWIEDEAEAAGASPFGVCFRPSHARETAPFPLWPYTPAYLPAGMTVGIGSDVPLAEPMWFFLAQATRPDAAPAGRRQPLDHPAGLVELTGVAVTVPGDAALSAPALAAIDSGRVAIATGGPHRMALTFDGGRTGRHHDFCPALPLVIHY